MTTERYNKIYSKCYTAGETAAKKRRNFVLAKSQINYNKLRAYFDKVFTFSYVDSEERESFFADGFMLGFIEGKEFA